MSDKKKYCEDFEDGSMSDEQAVMSPEHIKRSTRQAIEHIQGKLEEMESKGEDIACLINAHFALTPDHCSFGMDISGCCGPHDLMTAHTAFTHAIMERLQGFLDIDGKNPLTFIKAMAESTSRALDRMAAEGKFGDMGEQDEQAEQDDDSIGGLLKAFGVVGSGSNTVQ